MAHGLLLDDAKRRNLRLIRTVQGKDYPTYGFLILLGYFEHISTQCARFKGVDMQVFLDRKAYSGDLFTQLEQAELFIQNHLSLRTEIHGLQRTDTLEIPLVAIREALINAYVHRDYSNFGRNIKIGIYDDVLNIVSAGGFPNTLMAQDLAEGRSEIRNRVLARVFKALGYIEQWGSGIQRIRQVCLAAGLAAPTIIETGDFIDVTLFRPLVDDLRTQTDNLSPITPDSRPITPDYAQLSLEQQRILDYVQQHLRISRADGMALLGLGETKLKSLFNELVALGLLLRQGNGRATVYVLNQVKN